MHDYVAFLQARKIKQILWFNWPSERARKGLACPLRIFCLVPERKGFFFPFMHPLLTKLLGPWQSFEIG